MLNLLRSPRVRLWGRYSASSVIAGVISEVAFLVAYGLGSTPVVASAVAFVLGAVPNYLMNRYWAWQRRGRADGRRELLPYVVIIVVTAGTAMLVTTAAERWLHERVGSHGLEVALVGAAFLATYGLMFLLKFVLFDRYVFATAATRTRGTTSRS